MTYPLFKAFSDSVGRKMSQSIFDELLRTLVSTQYWTAKPFLMSNMKGRAEPATAPTVDEPGDNYGVPLGITADGFKQFFLQEIISHGGETQFMYTWLENLGFDSEFY